MTPWKPWPYMVERAVLSADGSKLAIQLQAGAGDRAPGERSLLLVDRAAGRRGRIPGGAESK